MALVIFARTPDYPFYDGKPVKVGSRGWSALVLSVALALAVLMLLPTHGVVWPLLAAVLFVGMPLGTLAIIVGRQWKSLFRPFGLHEAKIALLSAVSAMAASAVAAAVLQSFTNTVPNPFVSELGAMKTADYLRQLIPTAPQLLGEKLLTIFPFLAILWLCTQHFKLSRSTSLVFALIGSTLVFAAAHLPTYNWQVAQCFGVIGSARIVLTLSYMLTRNLWVSFGAHIVNDWTEFTFVYFAGNLSSYHVAGI